MNDKQRKAIDDLRARVDKVRQQFTNDGIIDELNEISTKVEELRDEEQEKLDNMPESFQNGEKGKALEDVVEKLTTAMECLNEVLGSVTDGDDTLGSAWDALEEAKA